MGEEIEFEAEGAERWTTYILGDGTQMKVKAVVADIVRIENEYAPNGDPLYTVNAQIVVNTNSPENLRKKS